MNQSKSQVFRCFVRKRPGFDGEAQGLLRDLREQLGIGGLAGLAIFHRYDVEGVGPETYEQAKGTVFSEPQVDAVYDEDFPRPAGTHSILAVEALPGQFDQRSDSAAQCVQLMTGGERPLIAYAKVYVLEGVLSVPEVRRVADYLINPVECREASMDKPDTLERAYDIPDRVAVLDGFIELKLAGVPWPVRWWQER